MPFYNFHLLLIYIQEEAIKKPPVGLLSVIKKNLFLLSIQRSLNNQGESSRPLTNFLFFSQLSRYYGVLRVDAQE